jgi:hypothetical protein
MGEVVNSKILTENKVLYQIELEEKDARLLKNRIHNVHLFDEELCKIDTQIIERGKSRGAKYFIVPKCLRTRRKNKIHNVTYQKIETDDKVFFICVAKKGNQH